MKLALQFMKFKNCQNISSEIDIAGMVSRFGGDTGSVALIIFSTLKLLA